MVKSLNELYIEYLESLEGIDRVVIHYNDTIVTSSQFFHRVEEIMKHLVCLGVREGSGVGYTLENCLDVIPLFLAISRLGAYAFPLFSGFPAQHIAASFQKGNISCIVTNKSRALEIQKECERIAYEAKVIVVEEDEEFASIFGDVGEDIDLCTYIAAPLKYDIPLMIGLSSGTTGIPKMVAMTQKNVGSEIVVMKNMERIVHRKLGIKGEDDSKIVAFPLSTSVMLTVLGMLLSYETICFTDNMTPMNFLEQAQKSKARGITCPPAYLESLLLLKDKHSFDLSSIETIEGGMDFFSASLIRRMSKFLPNLKIYGGGYGLVETCNVYMIKIIDIEKEDVEHTAYYKLAEDAENRIRVCANGKEVEDGETGEIFVTGPNVVRGYMESPTVVSQEFEGGWLQTGDIARKIDARTVQLLGREKFFIKRGGKSVSPIVVQAEINKTPGVKDSAVAGVPHHLFGEMIWALVVKEEGKEVTLRDIKKTCKNLLPYYMLPDQITFVDSIPKKNGVGKVDFDAVRQIGIAELEKVTSHE